MMRAATIESTRPVENAGGTCARVLAALAALLASAPAARAQWERLDRAAPHVMELVAATNLIVDRWPIAAQHYELVAQHEPDHPWADWLATRALLEAGMPERALEVGAQGLENPRVRAPLALELARAAASAGDPMIAVEFLELARDAQLVMPSKLLRSDSRLKALHKEPVMRELIGSVDDVAGRFAALADADDHDGLVMLSHASHATGWADIPSISWLLKDVVDELGRTLERGRKEDAARLVLRLERGARAADESLEVDLHGPWIDRVLAWSAAQRKQHSKLWKDYSRIDGAIRGHRFASVLETLDEFDRIAAGLGDFLARYVVDRTRGLVHSAILNYRQPRKGVSSEEEYESGRAAFQRHLDLALKLQDLNSVVDSYDFLACFEIQIPHLALAEAEQLVFGGIIASARLQPSERELGMFEGIWRDLQEIER